MSWLGKITGGAFGFLVGGPLGAAFGLALGHQLDQANFDLSEHQAGLSTEEAEQLRQVYLSAVFQVMGHVAKTDGRVSVAEIGCARDIMARMQLGGPDRVWAMRLFNDGKQPQFDLYATLGALRDVAQGRPLLIRFFMATQTEMALADGPLTMAKGRLMLDLCDMLGFSRYEFFGIRTRLEARRRLGRFGEGSPGGGSARYQSDGSTAWEQKKQPPPQRPLHDPSGLEGAYTILGLSMSASDDEIKRAYRRAISRNHPDKMLAQGLSVKELHAATETTQKIQRAYEMICRARAMRI